MNYYLILQLPLFASLKEIEKKYSELTQYYQDKENEEEKAYFELVKNAYATLSNPEKKVNYDNNIKLRVGILGDGDAKQNTILECFGISSLNNLFLQSPTDISSGIISPHDRQIKVVLKDLSSQIGFKYSSKLVANQCDILIIATDLNQNTQQHVNEHLQKISKLNPHAKYLIVGQMDSSHPVYSFFQHIPLTQKHIPYEIVKINENEVEQIKSFITEQITQIVKPKEAEPEPSKRCIIM